MKRTGNLIERICDIDNLFLAFYKAKKGKSAKKSVIQFEAHLDDNLMKIKAELLSGKPYFGEYNFFKIYDPKERLICSTSFRERVMHHAVLNICHEYFERHLIYHTYATRPGKGVDEAVSFARKAIRKYHYAVKMDVKKYYDSINHSILKERLSRLFKDRCLLSVLSALIDSFSTETGYGLPKGTLTSQYFANYYLSGYDHMVLEHKLAPVYLRYMDDMLMFTNSKEDAVKAESITRSYLYSNLGLTLNPSVITPTACGISFLGFRLYPHAIFLARKGKKRLKKKMFLYMRNLENAVWTEKEYYEHITPLLSFAKKAYSKKLRRKYIADMEAG